jgi:hypothetical protein
LSEIIPSVPRLPNGDPDPSKLSITDLLFEATRVMEKGEYFKQLEELTVKHKDEGKDIMKFAQPFVPKEMMQKLEQQASSFDAKKNSSNNNNSTHTST